MSKTTTDQTAALDRLREMLPTGATVRTILRHVSSSGMSRSISLVLAHGDDVTELDYWIARAGLGKTDPRHGGIRIGGCGMDQGFALVYSLSSALYPNGHPCTGHAHNGKRGAVRCPSNDHVNHWGDAARRFDALHGADLDATMRHAGIDPESREGREHYCSERSTWIDSQPDYRRGKLHRDGGYALTQRWL